MKKNTPKITVAMPFYNAARYLSKSIESVLRQDFGDFELIAYDDGSTDGSYGIAKQYQRRDARIRLYRHSENRGVGFVRNKILYLSRGEYHAPHDADDIMLAGRLSAGTNILNRRPRVGVVFGHALASNEAGKRFVRTLMASETQTAGQKAIKKAGKTAYYPIFQHSTVLFRKQLALSAGGYEASLRAGEDHNLFMRLWGVTDFYALNRYLCIYRLRPTSLTGTCFDTEGNFYIERLWPAISRPLVTVAMPVYNAEPFLCKSIESVLKQDFTDFELLIYDDGATDKSYHIASAYQKIDLRIRLFRGEKNHGVDFSRNKILSLARGRFVALHDADDIMLAGRLKSQAAALKTNPSAGVVFGHALATKPGEKMTASSLPATAKAAKGFCPLKQEGIIQRECRFPSGSAMFQRAAALRVGGFDERLQGRSDTDFFQRLRKQTGFYFLNKFFYIYRRHKHSLTEAYLREAIRERKEKKRQELERERQNKAKRDRKRKRKRRFDKVKKKIVFDLHKWRVEVSSEKKEYLRVVRQYLPYYLERKLRNSNSPKEILKIDVHYRTGRETDLEDEIGEIGKEYFLRDKFCYSKSREGLLTIYLKKDNPRTDAWLYHCCFLSPFHQHFLRVRQCILMHAALVAKNNFGVLIVGGDGAGKSTLAAAFIQAGWRYFSDEHTILCYDKGQVMGLAFANSLGILPKVLKNLPQLKKKLVWNKRLGKFLLNPTNLGADGVGKSCRIERIIFPRFALGKGLSVQALGKAGILSRLLRDEYAIFYSQEPEDQPLLRFHQQTFKALSRQARGQAVVYGENAVGAVVNFSNVEGRE